MDLGVLLGLPLESIAIRVALATVLVIVLVRPLLRVGLRSSGARVATALAPVVAIAAVLVLSWGSLHLPTLMLPVDAPDALPVPMRDGYIHFAPSAVPLLVASWAMWAVVRLVRRARGVRRARLSAELALREGVARPEVVAVAERLARRLQVPAPRVTVVPRCAGGAYVVGSRRPVLVIGDDLARRLDEGELEGVIAHELAHVRRRDNLVASMVGAVRDLTFFIPGGGWALSRLHRERELAADQVAVGITGRPGALASGLLKVLEGGPDAAHPCAALVPSGTLVSRVQTLVDERPVPSRVRRTTEKATVAAMCGAAVMVALAVPTVLAGADGERDALALVWSPAGQAPAGGGAPAAEARAFDVYRRTSFEVDATAPAGPGEPDERSLENRRSTLYACLGEGTCPQASSQVGLGLTPRPTITVDHELTQRWQATPVVSADHRAGFQVFWLQRVR